MIEPLPTSPATPLDWLDEAQVGNLRGIRKIGRLVMRIGPLAPFRKLELVADQRTAVELGVERGELTERFDCVRRELLAPDPIRRHVCAGQRAKFRPAEAAGQQDGGLVQALCQGDEVTALQANKGFL